MSSLTFATGASKARDTAQGPPRRAGVVLPPLGDAEQVPVMVRARLWDGMLGANRSHSRSYGEDLERRMADEDAI